MFNISLEGIFIFILLFFMAVYLFPHHGNKHCKILIAILLNLFGTIVLIYYVSDQFTGNGIDETVVTTLALDHSGDFIEEYMELFITSILFLVAVFILSILYYFFNVSNHDLRHKYSYLSFSITIFLISFLANPVSSLALKYYVGDWDSLLQIINNEERSVLFDESDAEFLKHYVNLQGQKFENETNIKKANLVLIYAESLERTFFNNKLFPDLELKNMRELQNISTDFSNIIEANGTSPSIAAVVASNCGLPFKVLDNYQINFMIGINNFYNGAYCISDFLKINGYYLSYVSGSFLPFAGFDSFLNTHKFDSTFSSQDFYKKYPKEHKKYSLWGYTDKKVFDKALNEFRNLSDSKNNFALYITTMDTHPPYIDISPNCRKDILSDESLLYKSLKCYDENVGNFINKILESKYAKNTIIVLASDHYTQGKLTNIPSKNANRSNLLFIIDPNELKYKKIKKIGSTLDTGPTILSKMGFKVNSLGLGRNLLSEEKTLIEKFPNSYNYKIKSWEKSILKFWKLPSIDRKSIIKINNNEILLGSDFFKYPIFMIIHENGSIEPWRVDEQVKYEHTVVKADHYKLKSSYILIDHCNKINTNFIIHKITTNNFEYSKDDKCFSYGRWRGKHVTILLEDAKQLTQEQIYKYIKLNSSPLETKANKSD